MSLWFTFKATEEPSLLYLPVRPVIMQTGIANCGL
jgi:hypothetical protein